MHLSEKVLGHKTIHFEQVAGSGKSQVPFDCVTIEKASEYAAEDADVTLRLWRALKPRMPAEQVATVYETLERPLVPVLARMEKRGISIDRQVLLRLSGEFAQKQAALEDEINKLAGAPINPGSPKVLGDILFDKMGLPGGTKTKTGQWATGAKVLEDLAEQGHELPQKILDWRQVSKLRSTYTDALPNYVNPDTKRVHTSYALAAMTTGRLSSSEPNLQNIPIRTEEGRKIRRAFIADDGCKLVSADYSQIELRLLPEVAEVPALRKAFKDGLDIHAMTASEMFGSAGQGHAGRNPPPRQGDQLRHHLWHLGVRARQPARHRARGGRRLHQEILRALPGYPRLHGRDEGVRQEERLRAHPVRAQVPLPRHRHSTASICAFNERAAINARLQGSAADIIRRAMIRVEPALAQAKLTAQMLLQVHDELIFEVPNGEVDKTLPMVKRVMEDAPMPACRCTCRCQSRRERRIIGKRRIRRQTPCATTSGVSGPA